MSAPRQPLYVCGHSAGELERLQAQGAFFAEITTRVFEAAGIGRGMRVLDIGCGVGDVSLLVAERTGPSGSVLGVDRAPQAIATATARAAAAGLRHVAFRCAEIEAIQLETEVDALVGRFVLMHQPDPARTLRAAARHVRAGGIVALLESQMNGSVAGVHSYPYSPAYDRIVRLLVEIVRAAGADPDMGLRLPRTFRDAGLPTPNLWLQARVDGGPDAAVYRYVTESLRSMVPVAEQLGIATVAARDVDALERELREEVSASGGVVTSPLVASAWCQLP